MAASGQALSQLEGIQAQLQADAVKLFATSKFTVIHLVFNSFGSTWPLATCFPHVTIGMCDGQPVYTFPTRGAISTVSSGATPNLAAIENSSETLEDVIPIAPFNDVDGWRLETSGSLSRDFRALLKYLFLLNAVEGGSEKNMGMTISIDDLKAALVKIQQKCASSVAGAASRVAQSERRGL